jgi:Ni/Co efflux regulator RcnB
MRKLFVTAIVLGLFAVTPAAFAAQGDRHQDGKSDQRDRPDKSNKSDQRDMSDQGRKSGEAEGHNETRTQGQLRDTPSLGERKAMKTKRTRNAATANSTRNAAKANRTRNAVSNNRTRNAVATDRTPKTIAKRHPANVLALRSNTQASHRFHAGTYHRPHGYHFRHWRYGEHLPSFYFVSSYWIMDYLMYSLFAPPDGYVWVRVGDDALLIDRYTGEIIRVEYGVFY